MGEADQGPCIDKPHPQFFLQFAVQCFLDRLIGFDLSARKLPIPGGNLACGSLGDQDLASAVLQHTTGDANLRQAQVRYSALIFT